MQRGRGQPRAATLDEIHAAALDLFRDAGFESSTMPMIAERAGIGRSTLFRSFSSRADILWHGYAERTDDFREALAAQPAGIDVVDGAIGAYRSLWSDHPERVAVGKQVTMILEAGDPDETGRSRVHRAWGDLVHEWVLERSGRPRDDVAAAAAAGAIWAAIWAGAVGFAGSDATSIDNHLAQACAAIDVNLPAISD